MLTLRSSPASPFGRKIKIAASLLDLIDRIEIVEPIRQTLKQASASRTRWARSRRSSLRMARRFTIRGSSSNISTNSRAAATSTQPAGIVSRRFAQQALADGIMDAALIQVYECRWRPEEKREPKWLDHHASKIARGLDYAEANLSAPTATLHVGHIAQACALGYLDLRMGGPLARDSSAARRLAGGFRGAGADVRQDRRKRKRLKQKKPGVSTGLFRRDGRLLVAAELVVQASANHAELVVRCCCCQRKQPKLLLLLQSRFTYRPSILAVRLLVNAYSTPAPSDPAGVGAAAVAENSGSVRSDESDLRLPISP